MYVWSCSFADEYLEQLFGLYIKRSDEYYMLTNAFVKLNFRNLMKEK